MSQFQISVEENVGGFPSRDMTIQELLALDPTSINQYGSSSLNNNTCVPYDREYFIGKIEKICFNYLNYYLYLFRSTKL